MALINCNHKSWTTGFGTCLPISLLRILLVKKLLLCPGTYEGFLQGKCLSRSLPLSCYILSIDPDGLFKISGRAQDLANIAWCVPLLIESSITPCTWRWWPCMCCQHPVSRKLLSPTVPQTDLHFCKPPSPSPQYVQDWKMSTRGKKLMNLLASFTIFLPYVQNAYNNIFIDWKQLRTPYGVDRKHLPLRGRAKVKCEGLGSRGLS